MYNAVNTIRIERPAILIPPKLIFCFIRAATANPGTSNTTVAEFFRRFPTFDETIKTCHAKVNSSDDMSVCGNDTFIGERFMKNHHMCYSLKYRDDVKLDSWMMYMNPNGPQLYYLTINSHLFINSNYTSIYIHPASLNFYGKLDSFAYVTQDSGYESNVILSYQRYVSILLPYPYITACLNYKTIGYESHAHCYETCIVSVLVNLTGTLPVSTVKLFPYNLTTHSMTNEAVKQLSERKVVNCLLKCSSHDCYKVDYVPKIHASSPQRNLSFNMLAPNEPDIITVMKPMLYFIDFLTYTLSCLSFWLGFSPFLFLIRRNLFEKTTVKAHPQARRTLIELQRMPIKRNVWAQ